MIIAVFSDAHGNRKFFEKVFCAIRGACPDSIVYLGDVFGYMPYGREILKTLRRECDVILKGNHEAMLLGERHLDLQKDRIYGLEAEKKRLLPEEREFLCTLSSDHELCVDGKRILFVHGSPQDSLTGYLYEDCPDYVWELSGYDYVFMGHTHRPYVKAEGHTVFINVGSCGLPRDIGLSPGYALLDTDSGRVEIKRVIIDAEMIKDPDYREVGRVVLDVFQRGGKQ